MIMFVAICTTGLPPFTGLLTLSKQQVGIFASNFSRLQEGNGTRWSRAIHDRGFDNSRTLQHKVEHIDFYSDIAVGCKMVL